MFWARKSWIEIKVQFLFLMKKNHFLVLVRVKNPKMGYPKKHFDPLKVGFFGPGGHELKLRSYFRFFHFLTNFIISCFFQYPIKMFVWVWPIILWTKKTPLGGGGICSKGPNVRNQFFGKKNFGQIFWNFFSAHLMRNFFLIETVWRVGQHIGQHKGSAKIRTAHA